MPTVVPVKNLFPETLEYRPPREIIVTKKPVCFIHKLLSKPLLIIIFNTYLRDDGGDDYRTDHLKHRPNLTSNLSSSASPLILAAVCKQWRKISYARQDFWRSLAVYKPRSAQFSTIKWWLKYGQKNCLLSLYLHAPPNDEGHDQSAIEWVLKKFVIEQDSSRIKRLTIKLPGDFPVSISNFNAPHIEVVEFDFGESYDTSRILFETCGDPRNPKKVSWRPPVIVRPFLPFSTPWDYVTHLKLPINTPDFNLDSLMLSLICCSRLVNLEIVLTLPPGENIERKLPPLNHSSNPKNKDDAHDGQHRLKAIRKTWYNKLFSPSPWHLEWDDLVKQEPETIRKALLGYIDLPRLRHLRIEAHGRDVTPILDRLTVRYLRSLEVIHRSKLNVPRESVGGIVSLLRRNNPPLTSLYISDPGMSIRGTLDIVELPLTKLRELELWVPRFDNSILRALTPVSESVTPTKTNVPMPELRKLVLSECVASRGHLTQMVVNRLRYSPLKELRMSFPSVMKTDPKSRSTRWTLSAEGFDGLTSVKDFLKILHLREGQFTLTVD